MPTVHLLIKGKVQGVFYRATAREMADDIGVTGWVKNTDAGDVEAVATGTQDQIKRFVDWCKTGPRRANVTEVILTEMEGQVFDQFKVIRGE